MDEQTKDEMVIEIPHTFKIKIPQPMLEMLTKESKTEEDLTRIIHETFDKLLPIMDHAFSTLLYPAIIAMKSGVVDESDLQKDISKYFELIESEEV